MVEPGKYGTDSRGEMAVDPAAPEGDVTRISPATDIVFLCVNCGSVHFNVKWSHEAHPWRIEGPMWRIACEGCGTIYNLNPLGFAEVFKQL